MHLYSYKRLSRHLNPDHMAARLANPNQPDHKEIVVCQKSEYANTTRKLAPAELLFLPVMSGEGEVRRSQAT